MFARTYGATTMGVDGLIIDVEVDSAAGLPGFDIVGLPDTAVKEAKERLAAAPEGTSMETIGYESGFSTRSQFYRSFKKETGVSPGQWLAKK